MYPGMMAFWRRRGCGGGGAWRGALPMDMEGLRGGGAFMGWHGGDDPGGGAFGVRRPLRFLAYKLALNEQQVAELAKILDELKTERAQAAVDDRRTTAAFADAMSGEAFDSAKAAAGGALRVEGAERLRAAVLQALGRIHALLDAEQRKELAYLIRTGALTI